MGREEGREPSPQRQEPAQRLERRSSPADDCGQQRRRSRSPQRRGSKDERQHHKQRDEGKQHQRRSRSRSPPHGGRGDERRSGSGSRPDSGRGGERGALEQEGQQRRGSPDQGRSRRESPGRERSRRNSPDYGDAGPSSRQRSQRSPSPPWARGGWQGDRSGARGGRGGWQGDRDRRGSGWEGDRDRRGGKDWDGGRGGRGDWRSRGPPDRGGRGRDGGWGSQDGGSERRDPGLGPRFMPRVMQRQHPGEERVAYGRRGERPRSRSPPRHEKAPPLQPAGMVADNPEAAADIVRKMMGGPHPAAAAAAAPAPGSSGLSLEQKKKLLWGGKKKETTEGAPAAVFGHNRWDQAELASESDKLKFLKLMGGRTAAETLQQAGGSLPQPQPEERNEPVFGPAAPWEVQQQQQQLGQQQAAAAEVPTASGQGIAAMEVAAEGAAPVVAGPTGPALEGAVPAGPANIMKREGQQRVLSELEREFNSGLARRNRTTGLGA